MTDKKPTAKKPRAKAKAEAVPPQSDYDRIANRFIEAVDELNNALKEASRFDEISVKMGRINGDKIPAIFGYKIYRLTHKSMAFEVKTSASKLAAVWKALAKDDDVDMPS